MGAKGTVELFQPRVTGDANRPLPGFAAQACFPGAETGCLLHWRNTFLSAMGPCRTWVSPIASWARWEAVGDGLDRGRRSLASAAAPNPAPSQSSRPPYRYAADLSAVLLLYAAVALQPHPYTALIYCAFINIHIRTSGRDSLHRAAPRLLYNPRRSCSISHSSITHTAEGIVAVAALS